MQFLRQGGMATLFVLVLFVAQSAAHAQIHVPADHTTIQAAIDAASDGDQIIVAPGTYAEAIDTAGKAIHLRSSDGAEVTIIDATGLETSVVTIENGEESDTILEGFTITGGVGMKPSGQIQDTRGGGMFIAAANPTIVDCIVTGNDGTRGGGMYLRWDSSPTVTGTTFIGNTARDGAGIHVENSDIHLNECTFKNNVATEYGGAVFSFSLSHTVFEDCLFEGNAAGPSHGGGVLYTLVGATFEFTGCTFRKNTGNSGGAIWHDAQSTSFTNTIHDSVFEGNVGSVGGAIRNCGGMCQLLVTDSVFAHNTSTAANGGALVTTGDGTSFSGSTFCENSPNDIQGDWNDLGGNEFLDECPVDSIPGDLNGDGVVDVYDLFILLAAWGECADPDDCPADLDGNGVVDVDDLFILLANWG